MERSFQNLLSDIYVATDMELGEITRAVILRYGELFPDWEVMYLAIRRDDGKRREDIESTIRMLQGWLK